MIFHTPPSRFTAGVCPMWEHDLKGFRSQRFSPLKLRKTYPLKIVMSWYEPRADFKAHEHMAVHRSSPKKVKIRNLQHPNNTFTGRSVLLNRKSSRKTIQVSPKQAPIWFCFPGFFHIHCQVNQAKLTQTPSSYLSYLLRWYSRQLPPKLSSKQQQLEKLWIIYCSSIRCHSKSGGLFNFNIISMSKSWCLVGRTLWTVYFLHQYKANDSMACRQVWDKRGCRFNCTKWWCTLPKHQANLEWKRTNITSTSKYIKTPNIAPMNHINTFISNLLYMLPFLLEQKTNPSITSWQPAPNSRQDCLISCGKQS